MLARASVTPGMNTKPDNLRSEQLPRWERLLGGWTVKALAAFKTKEWASEHFQTEAQRIAELMEGKSEELGRQRITINRRPGMEPTSHDWSAFMTIEHLVIVNRGITAVIHALCADQNPGVEIRVEDIQPHSDAGPEQLDALYQSVDRYLDIVRRFGRLGCRQRYLHPWFGPLQACEWHVLAALHNRLHRDQIQRILRKQVQR
jgi:hypothetical protein